MKRFVFSLLMASTTANAAPPPAPVDQISQASIQAAFRVLQRDYIRREDLTIDQLNRAALQGLLARLSFGAEIVKQTPAPKADQRVIAESLTTEIAYIRPATYSTSEVALMEMKLRSLEDKGAKHTILDLRTASAPGEFEVAASLLELFLPRGVLLFKLRQLGSDDAQLLLSRREPIWHGTVVALVDSETNNLGETIATVLRSQKRALILGSPTKGATVRYDSVPLDQGWELRFARAEMLLPDDSSIFRKGLQPDFLINLKPEIKRSIFAQSNNGTIKPFVFEQARGRFNEAALVAGNNPELDDYIKRSNGETLGYDKPAPRDSVVQRAMDLIRTAEHLSRTQLRWDAKADSATPGTAPAIKPAQPVKP